MKEALVEALVKGEDLNKQGGHVWIERKGGSSAVAIHLGGATRGSEAPETVDRLM